MPCGARRSESRPRLRFLVECRRRVIGRRLRSPISAAAHALLLLPWPAEMAARRRAASGHFDRAPMKVMAPPSTTADGQLDGGHIRDVRHRFEPNDKNRDAVNGAAARIGPIAWPSNLRRR